MGELSKILIGALATSVVSVLLVGTLGWILKVWISGVNKKLDEIAKDIFEIKLKSANENGSQGTRFALVETKVSEIAEKIARLEGSTKRIWQRIEPQREKEGG